MDTDIRGIGMISVYAVDFEASLAFYRDVLGLGDVQPMGDKAAYIRFGEGPGGEPLGLYVIGGRTPPPGTSLSRARPSRSTCRRRTRGTRG